MKTRRKAPAENKSLSTSLKTFLGLCTWGCDLPSFEDFTAFMYQPTDPASLGVVRALFGLCMVLDVIEERGLVNVDMKWGDPDDCHFPLIHGLRPFSLPWMSILYAFMWIGAFGIMLGLYFKFACASFTITYWYIFILDKSFWNNHSYLYGIIVLLLWGTGANRYLALDEKLKKKKNSSVPYWNYFIIKFQLFTMYFIAGLKKFNKEWLEGYAMMNLSKHWVFEPIKLVLTPEQTDQYVVHWFGCIFDLSIGFFIISERTRVVAMLLCSGFHLLNSRLFSIGARPARNLCLCNVIGGELHRLAEARTGMFPFVCLATMPLFCRPDWPRKLFLNRRIRSKEDVDWDYSQSTAAARDEQRPRRGRANRGQKFVVAALLLHISLQLFLPYSHFVTKGFNNWVPGLYGYSWDMMVHTWDTVHIVIKIRDNENLKEYFLDPGAWIQNDRWSKHGDMVRQYAHCIKDNLQKLKERKASSKESWINLSSNLSVYIDVWCSLNGRFQQRLFNPLVDMVKVEWHPLRPISYLMPLLDQFNSYRGELERIQQDVFSWSNYTDVIFVADYPGMQLENYIDESLTNVTLRVLEGEIAYVAEEPDNKEEGCKRTIGKGGSVQIETGRFHKVETTSPHPACYMYTFANRTKQQLATRKMIEKKTEKDSFFLIKELRNRIESCNRSFSHIINAFMHIIFGVPMGKRISLD